MCFLGFAISLMVSDRDTHQVTPVRKQNVPNLCDFIIISAVLYMLHLLLLYKSLVCPHFICILYDEFSDNVRGEYTSAKYTMGNYETLEKLSELKWCIFLRNFQT